MLCVALLWEHRAVISASQSVSVSQSVPKEVSVKRVRHDM
jgi:hypothetical protein